MNGRAWAAVASLAMLVGGPGTAWAQSAASATEGRGDAAAADAARMERARRLAEHPLRVIQQAGRARRETEGDNPVQRVSVAVADAAVDAAGAAPETAAAPTAPPSTRLALAAPSSRPEAASALVGLAAGAYGPQLASRPRRNLVTAAPFKPAAEMGSVLKPVQTLPDAGGLSPELFRPLLLARVEPDVPRRVLVDWDPRREVLAELSIRADGVVDDAVLLSPAPYDLRRYVLPALKQWRFAPLPRARAWRVSLVFKPGD